MPLPSKLLLTRELWPGGPKVREVLEAQLSPPPRPQAAKASEPAVALLLLLR